MRLRHVLSCLALGASLFVLTGQLHGQRLEDGQVTFESSKPYRDSRILRNDLFKGVVAFDAKEKSHQEAVDVMGRDFAYPIYWFADKSNAPGKINGAVENFASRLVVMISPKFREKQAPLQQALCKSVMDRCLEISEKGRPIVAVNAALMLYRIVERRTDPRTGIQTEKAWADDVSPRLAEGNGDHLASACLSLLQNKQTRDGTRYYLFRTLSSLLEVPSKNPVVKKENEEKVILAALEFLNAPRKFAKNTPRDELEGYKVLRREAVKVVALSKSAVVADKGQAALWLARIAAGDERVSPPPRPDERLEAGIGLTRMIGTANKLPGFQADYAAAAVVRAVEGFGLAANDNIEKTGLERTRAWKVDAARFGEAIDAMKGDGKDKYVGEAVKQCQGVLSAIQEGNKSQANALEGWLDANPPASKSLIRGDDASTVKVAKPIESDK